MRVGLLSDTHNLLRPEVIEALRGCDCILHAGDVSRPEVLEELARVAPLRAVRGNNDKDWPEPLPEMIEFELGGLRACMAHRKKDLPEDLSAYDLAIYGHSHRYADALEGRTRVLNPGSCGPRRFSQPITLALLRVEGGAMEVEKIEIPQEKR